MEEKIDDAGKKPKNILPILSIVLALAIFVLISPAILKESSNFSKSLTAAFSEASVTVPNSLPTVTGVNINTTNGDITLTEGSLTNKFTVTGTVTDANGCKDLASVTVKVYKGALGDCTATNYDTCYVVTDSSPSTDTSCGASPDTTELVTGTNIDVEVRYYAEDGTWHATIIPSDTTGAGSVVAGNTSAGSTVLTTRAVSVTSTIAYGEVANGASSTGDHLTTITDTGNTATDFKLYGQDLTCTTYGSIPVAAQEYKTTSFSAGAGTALGATPGVDIDTGMIAPTHATYVTDTFAEYWHITIPYEVVGVCSGNVTFTAETPI